VTVAETRMGRACQIHRVHDTPQPPPLALRPARAERGSRARKRCPDQRSPVHQTARPAVI
jgi:hypothetical protein